MASDKEIRKIRIKKLKSIENAGLLAYPISTKRTHTNKEALDGFTKLSQKEIFLVGRIMSLRGHGFLTFANIVDGSSSIQLSFKKDSLGEKGYKFFLDHFDRGDFISVKGELFKTKRGEKTLNVTAYHMLSKSLLPLPEKWAGIKDIDDRFRKRYLDLIFNPEIKDKFILRSNIIKEIRDFFNKEGFLEVETPMLQPIYGGATAKPFKTHLNALDMDMYLRISPELYLKRLLVGGFEKVYEIGRCFRNEGVDRSHNPDFTILEFYWAYADYKDLMKFTEKLFSKVLNNLFNTSKIDYEDKKIDFKAPYKRIEYSDLFKKYTNINLEEINLTALKKEAKKLGIVSLKGGKAEIADEIFKVAIRPKIEQPTFIIHYPAEAFPLAKALEKDKTKSASFQLIIMGMEIIKAFSELNNPIIQEENLKAQEKIFKEGFSEAQRMDKDFIEALEYGMPPAAGWGMGIERLVMLLTNTHSVKEVILFPTMRPKK